MQKLEVEYHVYDAYRREAGRGQFALELKDGEEARAPMPFTPPRFGWYTYEVSLTGGGRELFRIGHHVGITPDFPGMVKLEKVEGASGTNDAPKQMFVGLPNMRLNATADPEIARDARAEHSPRARNSARSRSSRSPMKRTRPRRASARRSRASRGG